MAKRKKGTSSLPNDDFTWTDGSSLGLDTLLEDKDGEGVAQSARLPQVKGLSGLPGSDPVEESTFGQAPLGTSNYTHHGTRTGFEIGLGEGRVGSIRELLAADSFDENHVRLPALDWLDLAEQDPERLPKDCTGRMQKELEEAWGVHRRTNGDTALVQASLAGDFRLAENNLDLDSARYANLVDNPQPDRTRLSSEDLKVVVAESLRRSAAGYSLREVLTHTANVLGAEAPRVKKAMQALAAEHGLAGNVFVRSSAYPGCHNGKWTEHVNKYAKSAKYVVASDKCSDCVNNQKGCCSVLQRSLVASVPWEEARDAYLPRFVREGVKLASKGDPKEALRKAFSRRAPKKVESTDFPVEKIGQVRLEEKLRAARDQSAFTAVEGISSRSLAKKFAKVEKYLVNFQKAGLLTEKEIQVLRKNENLEEVRVRVATLLAKKEVRVGTHDTGERLYVLGSPQEKAPRKLTAHEQRIQKVAQDANVRLAEVNGMLRWVKEELNAGWAGYEFEGLLKARLAKPLLKAAKELIAEVRDEHEGLAGHLYVDAATYGDKRGVKGCEEGAAKHRGNDIAYVLRMAACKDCTHCNQHGSCTKYAKELVSREDFGDKALRKFQAKTLRMLDSTDAEKTASYFAPVENPAQEWGLQNDNLEDIDYYAEAEPDDMGDLADIAFGGMDLPDGWRNE